MEVVFLKLVNMSITASWLVWAIILLRLLFKKIPKWVMCLLWGFVAVRLMIPFSFESVYCLIPSVETIPKDFLLSRDPAIDSGIEVVDQVINPIVTQSLKANPAYSANPAQIWTFIAANIWIIGIAAMLIYAGISFFLIKRKLREAICLDGNIWLCDHVASAFVLGILRPRIYLPSDLQAEDREYVIAHERAHMERLDHIWKPLGFVLLTIYWFNPILWLAYILLCRDIEFACDEKVIKKLGVEIKKNYSQVLLRCSVSRKMIAMCPLAFGEVGVKERVRGVLNYKKPKFWIILVAVIICMGVGLCLLTNPANSELDDRNLERFLRETIVNEHISEHTGENFVAVDWEIMKIEEKAQQTSVYMWVLCEEYKLNSKTMELEVESGAHTPDVITVAKNGEDYELVEYWHAQDGSYHVSSIREKFPIYLWGKATDSQRYIDAQQARCLAQAKAYYEGMMFVDGTPVVMHGSPLPIESIETTYPQYCELDTKKGLRVYVWQPTENTYSCGLLAGRNHALTTAEMLFLLENDVGLDTMKKILSTYELEKEMIEVIPYSMTRSSYRYDITQEEFASIRWTLGLDSSEEEL